MRKGQLVETPSMAFSEIQAFVMPDNIYSSKALLKNGFQKESYVVHEKNWGRQEVVDVDVYTYISK